MSVWDEEFEDYELNAGEFEQWLDSIKSSKEQDDEEAYDEWCDQQVEEAKQVEYPEWVVSTPNYSMTISNN
tara:strand:- start:195 stop:407 length:213 start_codon:yes stop_codon:yes gene_type:complete